MHSNKLNGVTKLGQPSSTFGRILAFTALLGCAIVARGSVHDPSGNHSEEPKAESGLVFAFREYIPVINDSIGPLDRLSAIDLLKERGIGDERFTLKIHKTDAVAHRLAWGNPAMMCEFPGPLFINRLCGKFIYRLESRSLPHIPKHFGWGMSIVCGDKFYEIGPLDIVLWRYQNPGPLSVPDSLRVVKGSVSRFSCNLDGFRSALPRVMGSLFHCIGLAFNIRQSLLGVSNTTISDDHQRQRERYRQIIQPVTSYRHGGKFGDSYGLLFVLVLVGTGIACAGESGDRLTRDWLSWRWWLVAAILLSVLGIASACIGCLPWDWHRCLTDGQCHSKYRQDFQHGATVPQADSREAI